MIVKIIPAKRMPLKLSVLDYSVPTNLQKKIKVGHLVNVPFRTKELFGVVNMIDKKSQGTKKTKEILSITLDNPVFTQPQLNFLEEISILYHCSLGFLIKNNLMPLKKRKLKKANDNKINIRKTTSTRKISKPKVYIHNNNQEKDKYINSTIDLKSQNLILVPEINDIQKILVKKKLKDKVAYIDSNTTEKEMFDLWFDILTSKKNIVIGTRRALLLPWTNLKNIIVTSEGNSSYKSWDMAPRFHTRDACIILAKHHKAQLHLLDHSLSVETHFFTKNKVYTNVTKKEEKKETDTRTTIVDMRNERKERNYGFFSNKVIDAIQNIAEGDIFIFINKRGSASYVGCRDCGNVLKCSCNNLLTFHQDTNSLKCHYCKKEFEMPKHCLKCNGINISMLGVGTQLATNEVRKLLPNNSKRKVIRIDSDLEDIQKIKSEDKNKIIVGTQMAFSYIQWDKVKTIIYLDADTSLFVPEYKVSEGLWYQIQDTIYKMKSDASLYIQTSHPEHAVFYNIYNKKNFYNTELSQRKIFSYPPYRYLLKLFYCDRDKYLVEKQVETAKNKLKELTKQQKSINIMGPYESLPYWFKGRYCQILLAKIEYMSYKKDIKTILANLDDKWKVDPNPNNVLTIN